MMSYAQSAGCEMRDDLQIVAAEDFIVGASPANGVIVAVTENYTLPGMDFDQSRQAEIIRSLHESAGGRLVVVALRDPYELADFPEIGTYVCGFSFRPCAGQAAVEVLLGEAEARGRSPVSVPGTEIQA